MIDILVMDHEILIERLKFNFNTTGRVLSGFDSYLRSRMFCVKVEKFYSDQVFKQFGEL